MLASIGKFLPATVVVAITLFILRELFETWRRWKGRSRKILALRMIIARECELNYWTARRLAAAIEDAQRALRSEPPGKFQIIQKPDGSDNWHWSDGEGENQGGAPLPIVHRKVLDSRSLDVAELDSALFSKFEIVMDAIADLDHLRGSLLNYVGSDENDPEAGFFDGFTEYALEEIPDIEAALAALHKACTGRGQIKARLR